jgi:Ras-related protein Rab-5C
VFAAKKIPIEHILAATRGTGRPNAGSGRASGAGQTGNISIDENTAKPKDACNC